MEHDLELIIARLEILEIEVCNILQNPGNIGKSMFLIQSYPGNIGKWTFSNFSYPGNSGNLTFPNFLLCLVLQHARCSERSADTCLESLQC